jgi:signal peptidase I
LLRIADLAREVLDRSGSLKLKARGASMLPLLVNGDVVVIRATRGTDVEPGDVVCYRDASDRIFLHRLVRRLDQGELLMRGDALGFTERVSVTDVLGRAVAIERGERSIDLDTRWARRLGRGMTWLAPLTARALGCALAVRRGWRRARLDVRYDAS